MNLVLIGPQLPPFYFLVMKFKLHLCSRGNVYFGVKVLHIEISAPRCGRPQHKRHIHMKGLQGTKLRQSSHLYPGWSCLLSCLWAWSIRGKDKLEINLMKPRILSFPIWPTYLFFTFSLIWVSLVKGPLMGTVSGTEVMWTEIITLNFQMIREAHRSKEPTQGAPQNSLGVSNSGAFSIFHSETYVELVIFWDFYRGNECQRFIKLNLYKPRFVF